MRLILLRNFTDRSFNPRSGPDFKFGLAHASRISWLFSRSALSENPLTLSGQRHELFSELDDFSWQVPGGGNRR
jgi:hypothetical protein